MKTIKKKTRKISRTIRVDPEVDAYFLKQAKGREGTVSGILCDYISLLSQIPMKRTEELLATLKDLRNKEKDLFATIFAMRNEIARYEKGAATATTLLAVAMENYQVLKNAARETEIQNEMLRTKARKVEIRRAAGMKEQPYRDNKPWEAEGISRAWWYKRRQNNAKRAKATA